jgi:O-acetyl-ADP-ribose deacetylase (regulator of RNase III)
MAVIERGDPMRTIVKQGNIFDEVVDVLVSTANPQFNMSGGINGEILCRGGLELQQELHAYVAKTGRRYLEPATVVATGSGPLKNVHHIIHVIAIDVWYQSNAELVAKTITNALNLASELQARTVALPGLAMGYGRLPAIDFGRGLATAIQRDYGPIEERHRPALLFCPAEG